MRKFHTFKSLHKEALKYQTRTEFQNHSPNHYMSALRKNILNDICSHMILKKKPNGYWTKERLYKEALKYKTKREFINNNNAAYLAMCRQNFTNELCAHMIENRKHPNYWTLDKLKIEALKYNTRKDFQDKSASAYMKALTTNILDNICSHMTSNIKFTDNNCIYIWNIKDTNVYKIGVTSYRLKDERIINVARAHNVKYEIFALVKVNNAIQIETELHKTFKMGQDLIQNGDGITEFKTLNRTELIEALDYISQFRLDGMIVYPI